MTISIPRKVPSIALCALLLSLVAAGFMACSSDPSTLGQYRKGRTLPFSVVSVERTQELRYSTCDVLAGSNPPACDPQGAERSWSISPSAPGSELVLVRAKIENHTAVNAILNVGRESAELRDFANTTYFPIAVTDMAWHDFRGMPEAVVRVSMGECFDGTRALVDTGASVRWQSESEQEQTIAFEDSYVAVGAGGVEAVIAPQSSLVQTFDRAGTYAYVCAGEEGKEWPAVIRVAEPGERDDYIDRTTRFMMGSFELPQGHGIDGFLIFEAPAGTEFRDIRWRAGDSILFGF